MHERESAMTTDSPRPLEFTRSGAVARLVMGALVLSLAGCAPAARTSAAAATAPGAAVTNALSSHHQRHGLRLRRPPPRHCGSDPAPRWTPRSRTSPSSTGRFRRRYRQPVLAADARNVVRVQAAGRPGRGHLGRRTVMGVSTVVVSVRSSPMASSPGHQRLVCTGWPATRGTSARPRSRTRTRRPGMTGS